MKTYSVGIIGCTGMVGQRFISLLNNHSWFKVAVLAASARSAGKKYCEAVGDRWVMDTPIPAEVAELTVYDAVADSKKIAENVDFVFCAVDMSKEDTKALEELYAKLECPVMSNNSAHRLTPDVPMIIPEVNSHHTAIVEWQRRRLGTTRGFISVKSNCSLQSYVPALSVVATFGIERVLACTYQAISGAGKTFDTWQEMVDNVIPYIGGEEEKSEIEPLKIWGNIVGDKIVKASRPEITTQCLRVPVSNGHMAAVFFSLREKVSKEDIIRLWNEFRGEPQRLKLPSAPRQVLKYFDEDNRPQTRLDRDREQGMGISVGRLREDRQYDYKFVCLSHNTIRGAAGGAILMAELYAAKGYFD